MLFLISHTEQSSTVIVLDLFHVSVPPWECVMLVISGDGMSGWRNVESKWARKLGAMVMKNVSSRGDTIAKASFLSHLLLATTPRWMVLLFPVSAVGRLRNWEVVKAGQGRAQLAACGRVRIRTRVV